MNTKAACLRIGRAATQWKWIPGAVILLAVLFTFTTSALAFINAQDFGARGDGSDATAALQQAINSAGTSGDTVYIPAGQYTVSAPIVLNNMSGLRIYGDGPLATIIWGNASVAGKPVIQIVNGQDNTIESLSIWGWMNQPASAGIEADSSSGSNTTHLTVRDVNLGSPASSNLVDGIKFAATNGDSGNDQGFFENIVAMNFTHAAFSFTQPSSSLHTIIGGIVESGPIGVYSTGGSFKVVGTHFSVNDVNFDLENSSDPNTAGYQHAISIADISSEGGAGLMRTGTDPMMVSMNNIDEKGSNFNIPIIKFASSGSLVLNNSFLFYLGSNVDLEFTGGGKQNISLSYNYLGLSNVKLDGGSMVSEGNCWQTPATISVTNNAKLTSLDVCGPLRKVKRRAS